MDLPTNMLEGLEKTPVDSRSTLAIGEVNYKLTFLGRFIYKGIKYYVHSCSCGMWLKLLNKPSLVKLGTYTRCNECKKEFYREIKYKECRDLILTGFETPSGGILTLESIPEKPLKKNKYVLNCSVCSLDKELWPSGSIVSTVSQLTRNVIPCGCSDSVKWTREQHEVRIKRKCSNVGFSFLGFTGKWKGNCTKIKLYNSVTDNTWSSCTIANFYRGKGDPSIGCYNENLKGYYYLSIWNNFIKCGITNKQPKTRLQDQASRSKLKGVLHFVYENDDGGFIRKLEASVLRAFHHEIVTKDVFPDGYTETFHKYDLENIIQHANAYCSSKL